MPRELIEPHKSDKRYIRRGKRGAVTSRQVDVGRSLSADPAVESQDDREEGRKAIAVTVRA